MNSVWMSSTNTNFLASWSSSAPPQPQLVLITLLFEHCFYVKSTEGDTSTTAFLHIYTLIHTYFSLVFTPAHMAIVLSMAKLNKYVIRGYPEIT